MASKRPRKNMDSPLSRADDDSRPSRGEHPRDRSAEDESVVDDGADLADGLTPQPPSSHDSSLVSLEELSAFASELEPADGDSTGAVDLRTGPVLIDDRTVQLDEIIDTSGEDSGDFSCVAEGESDPNSAPVLPDRIGDYEIGPMIGSGGMGHVFKAEHVRMQRRVALKVLPTEAMKNDKVIERFYAEVRAAGLVMHPNIVTALDAGEDNGIHFLVMEYVDGVTLTTLIARGGPVSMGQAAGIVRQAAMGLLHAHRMGLVHRDVKPGNLMRAHDGTIKVLDLGLARIHRHAAPQNIDEADRGKNLIGTLAYMAPEQLESAETADPRSDIYALGATMHFLLTGRSPYSGSNIDQAYGHRHGPIPDLMDLCDVDMNFANVFERMMAKDPDERFASLDEVVEALAPYASESHTPQWLTEFAARQTVGESSGFSTGSSMLTSQSVMGIDLGMFHAAAAECTPQGETEDLPIEPVSTTGSSVRTPLRLALASDGVGVAFGTEAYRRRLSDPASVVHCILLYIGQKTLRREFAGTLCPPEALLGLMLRRIVDGGWPGDDVPQAIAITCLASYDQMHRRSLAQAASIAGITSFRLIDRSIACTLAVTHGLDDVRLETAPEHDFVPLSDSSDSLLPDDSPGPRRRHILYVGLGGQGTEVAWMQIRGNRLNQVSTAGHWNNGALAYLQRLVDLVATQFIAEHGIDPKKSLRSAASLQVGCERAMLSMAILERVNVTVGQHRVSISRDLWIRSCESLLSELTTAVDQVIRNAEGRREDIDRLVMYGPLLRIPPIRERLLAKVGRDTLISPVDREAAARGAALCLSSQLPGRSGHPPPPRSVTSQTLGLVVYDVNQRRRILRLLSRGTQLPARVNRRVTTSDESKMSIVLAESSGICGDKWHTLGKNEIPVERNPVGTSSRTVSFEVDINGLLSIRIQGAVGPGSSKLPDLPPPNLTEAEILTWRRWVDHR